MILEQKWNILVLVLFIIGVAIGEFFYKPTHQTKEESVSTTITASATISTPHGEDDADYAAYIQYLEEKCPVYVPDGNSWKNCLYEMLLIKEAEVKTALNHINAELPKTIKRLTIRGEYFVAFEPIPQMVKDLDKTWLDNRDKLCELDNEAYAEGSATEGYVFECEVYETQKYINLLTRWDKEWNIDFEKNLDERFQNLK